MAVRKTLTKAVYILTRHLKKWTTPIEQQLHTTARAMLYAGTAEGEETEKHFTYRALTETDADEAKRFVYENYSKQLPLRRIFRVPLDELARRNAEQTERMIRAGTSFGCFHDPSGEMVGIVQCSVLVKGQPATTLESDRNPSPELAAMVRFCDWIMDGMFEELNARRLLLYSCGAMADRFKRQGLLQRTGSLTEDAALRHKCDYYVALAANAYSARSVEKRGISFAREIAFSEYVDPLTGDKPHLNLCPVHTHAKVACQKVEPRSS